MLTKLRTSLRKPSSRNDNRSVDSHRPGTLLGTSELSFYRSEGEEGPPPAASINLNSNSMLMPSSGSKTSPGDKENVSSVRETASCPGIYWSSIRKLGNGDPLYKPELDPSLPLNSRKTGVRVGDVGWITPEGAFENLFNVCAKYQQINPPDDFETIKDPEISEMSYFPPDTHVFNNTITHTKEPGMLFTYRCSGKPGAILELPEGATLFEARNVGVFHDLAKSQAESWYRYAHGARHGSISNGSLYLVTGCIKSHVWGIAVFDESSTGADYVQFRIDETVAENTASRYSWRKTGTAACSIGPSDPSIGEDPNQCIFLRGLTITLPEYKWDALTKLRGMKKLSVVGNLKWISGRDAISHP